MSKHWHYAQLELVPEDLQLRSQISPPVTRRDARGEAQDILTAAATQSGSADMQRVVDVWRRGPKDDFVFLGPFMWALFDCDGDCRASAQAFLDDMAQQQRAAGIDAQVVALPDDWPARHTQQ